MGASIQNWAEAIDTERIRAEEELEHNVHAMMVMRKRATGQVSMLQLANAIWRSPLPQSFSRLASRIFPKLKRKLFVLVGPEALDNTNHIIGQALMLIGAEIHTSLEPNRVYDLEV